MSNTRAHGEISSKMLISSFGTRDKKAFLKYPRTIDICTQCDNLDYVTQFTAILTKVCGKGISNSWFYWSATRTKSLCGTYDKVEDTTDTKITFTLLKNTIKEKEALARNALKPFWKFELMYGEKKSKMIIVIKIFCKCISILRLKGWIVCGGYYSKGILQHSNNLHLNQPYIWYTLAGKIYIK